MGTVSVSAQYYMNIRKSDGTSVQYVVTDIDSIWFTDSAVPIYEYVDLGLSVKWATCNVGATKPEEYGDYYAWGEIETKTEYIWSTYKWYDGSSSSTTKYNNVDHKSTLDPEDDVAHVKWGGDWRMPTTTERRELLLNCTWTWYSSDNTEFNGVAGYKVTSNKSGYTDRSIFIPAAGKRTGTGLDEVGIVGYYWCSSAYNSDSAWSIFFYNGSVDGNDWDYVLSRYWGCSIRPVCP